MFHLGLKDNIGYFSNSDYLKDATKVTFVIQPNESETSDTYVFRINSYRGTSDVEMDGYLDTPQYWHGSQTEPLKGTSSSVISQIAAATGLNAKVTSTVDTQTWFPRNIYYFEWARQISERGYRSDYSCMQLALTENREIRYLDLQDTPVPAGTFSFPSPTSGQFLFTDFRPTAASGSMNHQTAYQESRVQQMVIGPLKSSTLSTSNFKKIDPQGNILVSSKVKSEVLQSRVKYSPISSGNVHPFYEQALYQNRRLSNLFLNKFEALTVERTGLTVLDYVQVNYDDPLSTNSRSFKGTYWISAHAIYIHGNNYYEKFELVSNTSRSVSNA